MSKASQTPDGEQVVVVVSGGVNIIIQGLSGDSLPQTLGPLGDIDIEADRVVVWGVDTSGGLNGAISNQQSNDAAPKSTWKATSSSAKAIAPCTPTACSTMSIGRSARSSTPNC